MGVVVFREMAVELRQTAEYPFGEPEVFDNGRWEGYVEFWGSWTERGRIPAADRGEVEGGNESEIHGRPECRNKPGCRREIR